MIIYDKDEIQRPHLVTCVCIIGWVFTALNIGFFVFSSQNIVYAIPDKYYYFHWVVTAFDSIFILAYYGIWRLESWGLALFVLLNFGYFYIAHYLSLVDVNITDFVVNFILLLCLIPHINKFE